jgi:hypothetical protein
MFLRQSTASQEVLLGPFVNSTDGNTAETGLTIANTDIKVWKCGATTLASKTSGGATHISNGNYYAVLDATDTDTMGSLELIVQVSGALAVRRTYTVLPALVYDSLIVGGPAFPLFGITHSGTGQAATGTTFRLDSAAAFADDTVIGGTLLGFGSTQGYWQARSVTDNALTNDVMTVDAWTQTPSGTLSYVLFAGGPASATLLPAVNATQFAGQTITAAAGVTLPSSVASPTNITAGTITTVTTLTNLPAITANWLTATGIAADAITAAKIADGAIDAATFAADVDAEILSYIVNDATRIDATRLNAFTGETTSGLTSGAGVATFSGGHTMTIDANGNRTAVS